MQMQYLPPQPGRPNLLQKAVAIIVTAALVTLGLMFSAVLLSVILVVVAVGWVWLWWKTRDVRKQMKQVHEQMREFQQRSAEAQNDAYGSQVFREERYSGEIIEGEVVRVDTETDKP